MVLGYEEVLQLVSLFKAFKENSKNCKRGCQKMRRHATMRLREAREASTCNGVSGGCAPSEVYIGA